MHEVIVVSTSEAFLGLELDDQSGILKSGRARVGNSKQAVSRMLQHPSLCSRDLSIACGHIVFEFSSLAVI